MCLHISSEHVDPGEEQHHEQGEAWWDITLSIGKDGILWREQMRSKMNPESFERTQIPDFDDESCFQGLHPSADHPPPKLVCPFRCSLNPVDTSVHEAPQSERYNLRTRRKSLSYMSVDGDTRGRSLSLKTASMDDEVGEPSSRRSSAVAPSLRSRADDDDQWEDVDGSEDAMSVDYRSRSRRSRSSSPAARKSPAPYPYPHPYLDEPDLYGLSTATKRHGIDSPATRRSTRSTRRYVNYLDSNSIDEHDSDTSATTVGRTRASRRRTRRSTAMSVKSSSSSAAAAASAAEQQGSSDDDDDDDSGRKRLQRIRRLPRNRHRPCLKSPERPSNFREPVYLCPWEGCKAESLKFTDIKRHLHNHSRPEYGFECHVCGERFHRRDSRTRHCRSGPLSNEKHEGCHQHDECDSERIEDPEVTKILMEWKYNPPQKQIRPR